MAQALTWMVWPKRRTAPFFTGEMRLASDVTLPRGRTRLLLGSWRSKRNMEEEISQAVNHCLCAGTQNELISNANWEILPETSAASPDALL